MAVSYQPTIEEISAVTQAKLAVVTFTNNHTFTVGNTVLFDIPSAFGMRELDQKFANILAVTDDTITTDVNTSNFTPFSVPASYFQGAYAKPVGDTNTGFPIQGTIPKPIGIAGSFRTVIT